MLVMLVVVVVAVVAVVAVRSSVGLWTIALVAVVGVWWL